MSEIETEIRNFLRANFLFDREVDALNASASLIETGLVDSTGVLELLHFVEERFGVAIPDEDLVPEHFDSIDGISRYVRQRREQSTTTAD